MNTFLWILAILAAFILGRWARGIGTRGAEDPAGAPAIPAAAAPPAMATATSLLYETANRVDLRVARPGDLRRDGAFLEGLHVLGAPEYDEAALVGYATGNHDAVACMALELLARREIEPQSERRIAEWAGNAGPIRFYFMLAALEPVGDRDPTLVGRIVASLAIVIGAYWTGSAPQSVEEFRGFVRRRIAANTQPVLADETIRKLEDHSDRDDAVTLLRRLDIPDLCGLGESLSAAPAPGIDRDFLQQLGKVWTETDGPARWIVPHPALESATAQIRQLLLAEKRRSVLLVGEAGVGKSVTARSVLAGMQSEDWVVLEASSHDLVAGQSYIGQLEQRLQELVRQAGGNRRIVWYVSDFQNLVWTGRHSQNPVGALDYLLPHIEKSELLVLGEIEPGAYDRLVQTKPRVKSALEGRRITALPAAATLDLAKSWVEQRGGGRASTEPLISQATLEEAWQLARQYLGDKSTPGNLLQFLETTHDRLRDATGSIERSIGTDDLIVTLSQLTGLPASILDEREKLDVESLRVFFGRKVLGQPEAVDCLVDRVAMIKAGVTDPTRPEGVFLFAGPTGTGKTEIAKTLARFLFGSAERMTRLDMSEMKTADALTRILGDPHDTDGDQRSLCSAIRSQPFSVVLLDEFEKADPQIWDLFLQVFDDGRLTDRRGALADFRHTIIILTSNLGAMLPHGRSLGFGQAGDGFRTSNVTKAVNDSFRREFVNRLDRVVVFRPLSRDTMRRILLAEIESAFERRGLRNRGWAVEWEDSAIEFLLDRGFTHDLGARPLKRAIERYLLTPLAITIVNHQYPEGDQFLFVRRGAAALRVDFVDPDADPSTDGDPPAMHAAGPSTGGEAVSALERIALHPAGNASEMAVLGEALARLQAIPGAEDWSGKKQRAIAAMGDPRFWQSDQRFVVLGLAEYIDRIEAGTARVASLYQRLAGDAGRGRERFPRETLSRIAERLYLLHAACRDVLEGRPNEAFVRIQGSRGPGIAGRASDDFAERLASMYDGWARRRGMELETLHREAGDEARAGSVWLSVSGYGSWSILTTETGLHVLEEHHGEGHPARRVQARVEVVPQPSVPPDQEGGSAPALLRQAREALAAGSQLDIVRRYRETPSPLVRDRVRGWRTGHLERVLAGDFDLFGSTATGHDDSGGPDMT